MGTICDFRKLAAAGRKRRLSWLQFGGFHVLSVFYGGPILQVAQNDTW